MSRVLSIAFELSARRAGMARRLPEPGRLGRSCDDPADRSAAGRKAQTLTFPRDSRNCGSRLGDGGFGAHQEELAVERGFAVVGLGYVGLPVALALGRHFDPVVGFDISERRIATLQRGEDWTGEVTPDEIKRSKLRFTSDPGELA